MGIGASQPLLHVPHELARATDKQNRMNTCCDANDSRHRRFGSESFVDDGRRGHGQRAVRTNLALKQSNLAKRGGDVPLVA